MQNLKWISYTIGWKDRIKKENDGKLASLWTANKYQQDN